MPSIGGSFVVTGAGGQIDQFVYDQYMYGGCYYGRCDEDGNFYVSLDLATGGVARYNPDGSQAWFNTGVANYDSPANDVFGGAYVQVSEGTYAYPYTDQVCQKLDAETGAILWTTIIAHSTLYTGEGGCAIQANGDVWAAWYEHQTGGSVLNYGVVLDGATGAIKAGPVIISNLPSYWGVLGALVPNAARTAVFAIPGMSPLPSGSVPVLKFDASFNAMTFANPSPICWQTAAGWTSDGGFVIWALGPSPGYVKHCAKYNADGSLAWDRTDVSSAVQYDATNNVPCMDGKLYLYGYDEAELAKPTNYEFGACLVLDEATGATVDFFDVNSQGPTVGYDNYSGLDTFGAAAGGGYLWFCGAAYDNYNALLIDWGSGDEGYITVIGGAPVVFGGSTHPHSGKMPVV
jgi:hypothetical protein